MRAQFEAQTIRPGSIQRPLVWVDGGVASDDSALIICHHWDGGPLVGQRWEMSELARLFGGTDPAVVVVDVFCNEVEDPDNWYRRLDVDWADGPVADPSVLVWRGQGRA